MPMMGDLITLRRHIETAVDFFAAGHITDGMQVVLHADMVANPERYEHPRSPRLSTKSVNEAEHECEACAE